jgi:hypothetical protein
MTTNKNDKLFTKLEIEAFKAHLIDGIDMNEVRVPVLFDKNNPTFLHLGHLYSIYYDSYLCLLCGFYHPAIMLMSQLMEVTLKEIIWVQDGVKMEKPFSTLLKYAKNKNGERADTTKPLLHIYLISFLERVNTEIRNPYMHLNYDSLFQDQTIKIAGFEIGKTQEEISRNVGKLNEIIQGGSIKYIDINPIIDKIVAEVTKQQNEPQWAFQWAEEIYPLFWLLVEEYLSVESCRQRAQLNKAEIGYESIPIYRG